MSQKPAHPLILAVESSCDETAVSIVDANGQVLGDALYSQFDEHRGFGGVVPEIAARAHVSRLPSLLDTCLEQAELNLSDVDAFAATAGPGLIGGLLAGSQLAWALAEAQNKPYLAINHLEGHALTARLVALQTTGQPLEMPYLLLLISGGHCQLIAVRGIGDYQLYGSTIDDAAGEAFDKVAKMLGLGYPGGPAVERAARNGDDFRFDLPVPMRGRKDCDFSFSGLKTAVRRKIELEGGLDAMDDKARSDLAASFQRVIAASLGDRVKGALARFKQEYAIEQPLLAVAGGVAANAAIATRLQAIADDASAELSVAPAKLCTDNAVMIAWAAQERFALSAAGNPHRARPRWPLVELSPPEVTN